MNRESIEKEVCERLEMGQTTGDFIDWHIKEIENAERNGKKIAANCILSEFNRANSTAQTLTHLCEAIISENQPKD